MDSLSIQLTYPNGNGKGHRDPPLRARKLVCFGERIWIKIKEVVREGCLEGNKKDKRGKKKKVNNGNKAIEIPQSEKNGSGCFSSAGSGIRVKVWWEKENWAMVTDPENPFGDPTREEELRITELVKGIRKH